LIGIITDSTCDIPETLIRDYEIMVVPQLIIWGNEQYRDRIDMQPEEFYQRLVSDKQHPTSSQAGIPDFVHAYNTLIERGATQIIMITVSSAMSGTYSRALEASKFVNVPVSVVDSKGPTMTLGWQVLAAARARNKGLDLQEILKKVDQVRNRMVQFVCMDSLEYLQKGGRIGGAVKWVGSKLQVKPLVSINHVTGLVEPVGLAMTHKKLVDMMYSKFFSLLANGKPMHLAILHGNALDQAEILAKRIQSEFHPVELLINITGPVLGINTGPGALALCGYTEE